MSPRSLSNEAFVEVPVLRTQEPVGEAVRRVLESGLPALPVVDDRDKLAGIFGEREFMKALFPGYVSQLRGSGFLTRSIDKALEKRDACRHEPIEAYLTTDHVDVGEDYSDVQIAEIFLHHRVLIIPVIANGQVRGVVTRSGFFGTLAQRFLGG